MAAGNDTSTVLVVETTNSEECDRLIKSDDDKVPLIQIENPKQANQLSQIFTYLFGSNGYKRFETARNSSLQSTTTTTTTVTTSENGKKVHYHLAKCWPDKEPDNRRKRSNLLSGHLRKSCKSHIILLMLLILTISFLTFSATLFYKTRKTSRARNKSHYHDNYQRDRWLVSTSKCHIPKQDAWDRSIKDYVWREESINCSAVGDEGERNRHSLSYVANNKLFFNQEALERKALNECCYHQVSREVSSGAESDINIEEECIKIGENGFSSPFSVIKVNCSSLNYTNYHSFIVIDKEEEESCRLSTEKNLNTDQYYNILLVGVDTMSRLNAIRQFNKTLEVLFRRYNTTIFDGYNKVGENTFPNLVPFLTGLSEEQLVETGCWRPVGGFDPSDESGSDYFDRCKFLWNYFRDIGYRTYYSEDWSSASTFNYLKWGFKQPPTSSYGRPFVIARDEITSPHENQCKTCIYDKPLVEIDLENLETFISQNEKNPFFALNWINCPQHDGFNSGSKIDLILEGFFKRIHPLTRERTFVIFFSDHGVRYGDFVRNTRIGYYESSLPLLSIAAPTRFIRQHPDLYENLMHHTSTLITPYDMFKTLLAIQNLVKKKTPLLTSVSITPRTHSVKKANASGVTEAPKRVFGDLTSFNATGPTAVTVIRQETMYHGDNYPHKIKVLSLLDSHNRHDLDRSCLDVGIPDNYCRCHNFKKVDLQQTDVLGASYYLVYHHLYNELISKDKRHLCAILDFYEVREAEKYDLRRLKHVATERTVRRKRRGTDSSSDDLLYEYTTDMDGEGYAYEHVLDLPIYEYKLQVTTKPGKALFGEVVRYRGDVNTTNCENAIELTKVVIEDSRSKHEDKRASVEKMNEVCKFDIHDASIARLNAYRGQTDCLKDDAKLAKICYCKDLLKNKSDN